MLYHLKALDFIYSGYERRVVMFVEDVDNVEFIPGHSTRSQLGTYYDLSISFGGRPN